MKKYEIATIGDWATEERLQQKLARQVKLDMRRVPAELRKFAKIASQFGIADDALRQYQCSKHPIEELDAVYDAIEEARPAFKEYWDKLGRKILEGGSLSTTERCYFYLAKLQSEIGAGRRAKK